jgi:S-adenosylmethionine:tRNA ribosyltransferase-isomerase
MTQLDDYNYELPRELIAQHPRPQRIDARLMIVDRRTGTIDHRFIRDLPELFERDDCLVINETRVVPARLVGRRTATGGRWEGLYVSSDEQGRWRLLGTTRGKLQPGELITLIDNDGRDALELRLIEKQAGGEWLGIPSSTEPALQLLDRVGWIPLPHYIRDGRMVDEDRQRYQTVYAKHPGSVAAPTAGLHFTEDLLRRIDKRGVGIARVTLHVGLGTFRPIQSDVIEEHKMHGEWGRVDAATADLVNQRRAAGGRAIAVGTTCVRLLESAGAGGQLAPFEAETSLYIHPPYKFRMVDAMLTNFHLPKTTLLVLVCTFGGRELMLRAYQEAIAEEYQFFSYGDAMLIL